HEVKHLERARTRWDHRAPCSGGQLHIEGDVLEADLGSDVERELGFALDAPRVQPDMVIAKDSHEAVSMASALRPAGAAARVSVCSAILAGACISTLQATRGEEIRHAIVAARSHARGRGPELERRLVGARRRDARRPVEPGVHTDAISASSSRLRAELL